jgi:large subunit ribosomal protein L6
MSRVGKNPVIIPQEVECYLNGSTLSAKGKKGTLSMTISSNVIVCIEDGKVSVKPSSHSKQSRMMWGTTRRLVSNLVQGVSAGFVKRLEINGVGYRASVQGETLVLQLGFSHDVNYSIPADIQIVAEKPTSLTISGVSRQRVGQVAAEIRSYRGPEPYKGKGVKYEGEFILRKEGKKK